MLLNCTIYASFNNKWTLAYKAHEVKQEQRRVEMRDPIGGTQNLSACEDGWVVYCPTHISHGSVPVPEKIETKKIL